jgi:hypothetical protein
MVAEAPRELEFSFLTSVQKKPKKVIGIRDWFAETMGLDSSEKDGFLLPALWPFWEEVSSMKPLQAYGRISALQESSKKDMTIFGLTFTSDWVILVAPLTISLLTMYLFCHIAHITCLVHESDKAKKVMIHFPWKALFNDNFSRLLGDASIVLLPLLANLFLIWKFHHTNWRLLGFALILTIVSAMIGWLARSRVAQLRHRIHERPSR